MPSIKTKHAPMDTEQKPDFELMSESYADANERRGCSSWLALRKGNKAGMEEIWTDYVTPLRSENKELKEEITELDSAANYIISEISENSLNIFDALEDCWKALCSQGIYKHFNEKEVERIQSLMSRSKSLLQKHQPNKVK